MKVTHSKGRRGGFTIAEMMVVIVIIGLLATLVVPRLGAFFGQAQSTRVKADITGIMTALDSHKMINAGQWPDSLDDVINPPGGGEGLLTRIPKDPWNEPYQYEPPQPGSGGKPRVFTLGSDKAPGGEGEAADISNFDLFGDEDR
jgi:general secretion pathway protein G